MYHSIIIDTSSSPSFNMIKSINTYDDWFLIPESRPTISNPPLQSSYIDVPGASGSIDASEWLTGFPLYGDREGDLVFYVENDHGSWINRRNNINAAIHGRKAKILLEDEKDYFYKGRLSVNDWSSEKNWSKLTIHYRFEPFKYSMSSSNRWKWDPFNFEIGKTHDGLYGNKASGTHYFSGGDLPTYPSYGYITLKTGPTPSAPVTTATINFINYELGINTTVVVNLRRRTLFPNLLFSNLSGTNLVRVDITGNGIVDFDVTFRSL